MSMGKGHGKGRDKDHGKGRDDDRGKDRGHDRGKGRDDDRGKGRDDDDRGSGRRGATTTTDGRRRPHRAEKA